MPDPPFDDGRPLGGDSPDDEQEAASFARLAALHRSLRAEDLDQQPPPPEVWQRISASLHASSVADGTPSGSTPTEPTPAPVAPPAQLVGGSRRNGRPHQRRLLLAAAAVVLAVAVVVGGVAIAARSERSSGTESASAQLSNAGLDPRGSGATGTATLVRRGDRSYLRLHLVDVPDPHDGYLEVWLIDRQIQGMVSLGPYRGTGDYLIPPGIDPSHYPIVDLSDEPPDGIPTHSGISVLRGDLA